MQTGMAHNAGIELFWMDEGNDPARPDQPAVVLVNGAGSTSVMWCRELIDPVLAAGHRVIRFDNRDVGRSTRVPSDRGYRLVDMAGDLRAVLDHLGIEAAHVLGRSMGGAIILTLAAEAPERVRSLTLIYTSPCLAQPDEYGLPGPEPWVLEAMGEAAFAPPPADDAERVVRRVAESLLYAGTRFPFDDDWARTEAEDDVAHAANAETGHGPAVMASHSLVPALARMSQPALVLHGTADPIIGVAHGRLLAQELPDAELIEYKGLGHEMPPAFCTEMVAPFLALVARS